MFMMQGVWRLTKIRNPSKIMASSIHVRMKLFTCVLGFYFFYLSIYSGCGQGTSCAGYLKFWEKTVIVLDNLETFSKSQFYGSLDFNNTKNY